MELREDEVCATERRRINRSRCSERIAGEGDVVDEGEVGHS
jgi:hypothetical protein